MAEEPEWRRRVDGDRERRHLSCVGGDGLVTRVDATRHGLTGRGEGRLCHRVVLWVVDERNRVTDSGGYRVRGEGESAFSDFDLEVGGGHGGGGGDGEGGGGKSETHLENFLSSLLY